MQTISETTDPAKRILAFGGFLFMSFLGILVAYFDPQKVSFFPRCLFHELTGFACTGCGLTRGFHALFRGDFSAALHYNALFPLYGILLGSLYLHLFLLTFRGKGIPLSPEKCFRLLTAFLIIGIIFGVLRNLPFYPFTLLYPF
ncbi:MAG: DUF2752 domain-containing protein [Acidobacteria bacterium]|jgi:hypothetical protein|nr:MAG: DUF2752 domain-containing protein [Acidobacteriota bacterium]GIU81558.1 MAG: hypothetical protein KatS3mg006_0622 [Pyrinomonadaceae bacterium]